MFYAGWMSQTRLGPGCALRCTSVVTAWPLYTFQTSIRHRSTSTSSTFEVVTVNSLLIYLLIIHCLLGGGRARNGWGDATGAQYRRLAAFSARPGQRQQRLSGRGPAGLSTHPVWSFHCHLLQRAAAARRRICRLLQVERRSVDRGRLHRSWNQRRRFSVGAGYPEKLSTVDFWLSEKTNQSISWPNDLLTERPWLALFVYSGHDRRTHAWIIVGNSSSSPKIFVQIRRIWS